MRPGTGGKFGRRDPYHPGEVARDAMFAGPDLPVSIRMHATRTVGYTLDTRVETVIVHERRSEQLRHLGLSRPCAETFADRVDWHAVADLIDRGCSVELALGIVC
jgi:hypothetical protein